MMKEKNKQSPSPTLMLKQTLQSTYPSLPDDLLLSCFARVSRLYYPTLSLVSKRFRSLIASPELYKACSLLEHTENCLYVCMDDKSDHQTKWFTLCLKPHQTLTDDTRNENKYVLAGALIPHSPVNISGKGLVAVGSSIYNIGGSRYSSNVSILDCTTHTWKEAPSFPVKLVSVTASVADRKVYVAGSYKDDDTHYLKDSIEVFDTETQIWSPFPIPTCKTISSSYAKIACIDGQLQLATKAESFFYNAKEGKWDLVRRREGYYRRPDAYYCEIENVLYTVSGRSFGWYDNEIRDWRMLEGLNGLPDFPGHVRLANYGGKMVVLWDQPFRGYKKIWCAVIALKRVKTRRFRECAVWGKVEWFDIVLIVPVACDLVNVLGVTVDE